MLKVARSTYYANGTRKPCNRKKENKTIRKLVLEIYLKSGKRYGVTKITEQLRKKLYPIISVNRVSKLMKQLNIRSIIVKKFRNYRHKQMDDRSFENLVNQNFRAEKPNQIWLSDITYIHTIHHGWTYLASVLDVCTRKIAGYSFSKKMNSELVKSALKNAVSNQNNPQKIILHSDRGSQYTSNSYTEFATELGMILSYSRKGNPFDNAPIESFHATLKKEEVYLRHYKNFDDAKSSLFEYIEGFYNRNRIHSAIGYLTPHQFEKTFAS